MPQEAISSSPSVAVRHTVSAVLAHSTHAAASSTAAHPTPERPQETTGDSRGFGSFEPGRLISAFRRGLTSNYYDTHDTPTTHGIHLGDIIANRLRGGQVGIPHIVSKWRRLEKFNPKSQESILILTSILDDPADRRATTALRGEDAAVVLDILAGVRICPPI